MIAYISLYKFLQTIPKGKVVTYKYLAEVFKIHPRYVGKILQKNQDTEKYPCYKVIRSDRSLGWYNQGIEVKIKKLEKDGIKIENNTVEEKYVWKR